MSEKKLSIRRDRSRPQCAPLVLALGYTRSDGLRDRQTAARDLGVPWRVEIEADAIVDD
jgi:hypothetical protein